MQKQIFVVIVILTVVLQSIVAQRISDTKCQEYSKIPRDPVKPQPHMVWLRIATEKIIVVGVLGTLISDKFVLTSAVSDLILFNSQVYFTPDEQYNIVERFTHPLFDHKAHFDIALLRLETKIKLDSFHRPACLWTKNYFESTHAELMKWSDKTWTDDYKIKSLKIVTGPDCTGIHPQNNASLMCLKPEDPEDNKYVPAPGSPVQVYRPESYLPDNHFIYGIFSFFYHNTDPHISIGVKTYVHLDYIESIVWGVGNKNCGRVQINFTPFITFSMPTFHGEFPWHTAIFRSEGRGNRKYICGGSLLTENTVLTAAHCVSHETGIVSPTLLIISVGKYDLDTATIDSRESRVDRVIPHERFNRNYLENDVAILKLKTLLEFSSFIQPICITNDPGIFDSNIGVATGWGRNEFNVAENVLTKASLPIKTDTECRNSNRNVFPALLNGKNFCAGYQNGTSVCSGDSGGGLVFKRDEQWYIRGIVSLGISLQDRSQCDTTQLVLFTDVVKFFDWITDKL